MASRLSAETSARAAGPPIASTAASAIHGAQAPRFEARVLAWLQARRAGLAGDGSILPLHPSEGEDTVILAS
ncbi:hypothetical protein C5708_17785 [Caulobacter sp. CCUG 60055]|nr:hypothetical protein [Caulobacter sp. CCUG 60055]